MPNGEECIMALSPTEVVSLILRDPRNIEHLRPLMSEDFTYVSLNYEDSDLKKIMPWCGTSRGIESLIKTFVDVGRYWRANEFSIETIFGQGGKCGRIWSLHLHMVRLVKDSEFAVRHFRKGIRWAL
jgi:hypothetical protein